MAGELYLAHPKTEAAFGCLYNPLNGYVWYLTGGTFEVYGTGGRTAANYALTITGHTGNFHTGDMPSGVPTGEGVKYIVMYYARSTGTPLDIDLEDYVGDQQWENYGAEKTGYVLSAVGLDQIPITAPAGVASTFREMVVQNWRRFFKKVTLTSTQLKTYADNGTSVATTQVVSDDDTTETQGAAA